MCHKHYKSIAVKVRCQRVVVVVVVVRVCVIQIYAKSLCSLIWKGFAKIACCVTSTCTQPCPFKQAKKMRSRGENFFCIAPNSHCSMSRIAAPLRELLESCRLAGGGSCALIRHVPYRLQGGSPWSLSINRIDNAKGIGYPIANVEVR